jgi:hypothetical protein
VSRFLAMCNFVWKVHARRCGANLPWIEEEGGQALDACVRAASGTVFRIRRLPGEMLAGK